MSSITGVSHSNNLQDNNGYYDPATASPNNSKKRKQQCQYPVTQSNESPLGLSFSAYPPPSRWDTYSNTPSNMYAPTTSVPLEYPPQEPHHHPTSTHSSEPGWPHHSLDDLPHTPLPSASPNNDEHSLFENMHSTMMTPPNNAEKTAASSYPQFMHNELSTGTFSVPPPPQLSNPMEPRDINDIHHMLELDPFSSPDYRNEQGRHPRLHLQNINTAPPRQSSSPSQQSSFSPGTPGFFTPGFLGALQEDEETTFPAAGWNPAHYQGDPDSMMSTSEEVSRPQHSRSSHSPPSEPFSFPKLQPESLPFHSSQDLTKTRPYIQRYLSCPDPTGLGEKTVVILTSKVAQKSYGTEKRFLCPPPTTILEGISWWTSKGNNQLAPIPMDETGFDKGLAPPRATISIASENAMQTGQVEWYTCSGASVGQTTSFSKQQPESTAQDSHPSRFKSSESRNTGDTYHNPQLEPLAAGKCVSKHLFINDADEKRKRVECLIRLQLANGLQLGTIASKAIKVISKPSKKRQSAKNMELCLHHGTTVSLFNRIRSQTVSTKYLGVSTGTNSPFYFPGQNKNAPEGPQEGTCFVARTTCWDPFVIWIVDTTRAPSDGRENDSPEDYIGRNAFVRSVPYPPPPAIALKNKTSQLVPIHYNQHIVLQCLTTGLVSPVMIIRKVDKASTVVGGARTEDAQTPGGEYGDEVLGDPVSQLHKIALQIVQEPKFRHEERTDLSPMPRSSHPISYLACLNDMVGMHKTTEPRKPIHDAFDRMYDLFDVTSQEGGKVVRKRRVSTDILSNHPPPPGKLVASNSLNDLRDTHDTKARHRMNSLQDDYYDSGYFGNMRGRSGSIPEPARKLSVSSSGSAASGRRGSVAGGNTLGSFWSEDVTDAAVWTIVGTDCATYTFWTPPTEDPLSTQPFPLLSHISVNSKESSYNEQILSLHGENFSRDLQVWFGDLKAPLTEYKGRELLICKLPTKNELIECQMRYKEIPILLVRADGTICKTKINYCK